MADSRPVSIKLGAAGTLPRDAMAPARPALGGHVMAKLRVVHYLNQFFAGSGGEDKAGAAPEMMPGPVGPGHVLQRYLGETAEVVATVSCGDNFFSERDAAAVAR